MEQDINVTADIIVQKGDKVLLIKRKNDPFKGEWALPGGFVETEEEVATAAMRELKEETSIELDERSDLKFLGYFDAPDRDPRGRTISFAFGLLVDDNTDANAGDDAGEAKWFPINDLPNLAFDHLTMLARWKEL